MHLLNENCKLLTLLREHLKTVVLLLSQIALQLRMTSFLDAYCLDLGQTILPKVGALPTPHTATVGGRASCTRSCIACAVTAPRSTRYRFRPRTCS